MSRWSYRPELDGLRAVAVYLVVLFHTRMTWMGGGFIGVDLFFVLSGFLVSQVIFAEIDERGRLRVGAFYGRRVRRLLPAAVVVIVITSALQLLTASQPQRAGMIRDAQAALLYVANWHFLAEARDYFASAASADSPFVHFWSLSIEEQFYIGFPVLIVLVWRLSRRPARLLAGLLAAVTLGSVVWQLVQAAGDPTTAYYATHTRIYQLTLGVLLALVMRKLAALGRSVSGGSMAALAGLGAVLLLGSGAVDLSAAWRGIAAAAASAVTIGGLYLTPSGWPSRMLALGVPRYLGQISYGTYLWHWPVIVLLRDLFTVRPVVLALLAGAVASGLAALTAELLELPIRRSPRLAPWGWAVVVGGLTLSVTAAVLVVPKILDSPRRPVVAAPRPGSGSITTGPLARPVPADLDLKAALADVPPVVPDCTPKDPTACRLVEGAGPHVLLLGDSQARTFQNAFEALAEDHGWSLSVNILSACSWESGLQNEMSVAAEQQHCRDLRERFYARVLPQMDVDVVVAISLSRTAKRWDANLTAPGGPAGDSLLERHARATRVAADAITATDADLIIVKSLLGTAGYDKAGWNPLDCLARAHTLGECAVRVPLERPATDGLFDALAIQNDQVATVELSGVYCPGEPLCSPVLGQTVVWIDPDHVTASVLTERRSQIYDRLRETGLLD